MVPVRSALPRTGEQLHYPAMVRLLAAVCMAALAACQISAVTACKSDEDCSLLGVCSAGICHCDSGWTGPDCAKANLKPLNPAYGYQNTTAASWGGRPLHVDDQWHLFATEIANKCPLILFEYNSQVVRLVGDSPTGPFTRQEVVLPPFHHNPTAVGTFAFRELE